MLFNSYEFLLAFLPITLGFFFFLGRFAGGHRYAVTWLVAASFFFYGWWNPYYLTLLLFSIVMNYGFGAVLKRLHAADASQSLRKTMLGVAVAANFLMLGYYKYTTFVVTNLNDVANTDFNVVHIILPLGISFFTFTQVAYLVDLYKGLVKDDSFLNYLLFVTFFPHLIAGPIIHHRDMMPQFSKLAIATPNWLNIAVGLTIFVVGLFKKVVLADTIALYANILFAAPGYGSVLQFFDAWMAALTYSLQLYFDFSGYSEMAVGLALLFNIRLPINFLSPYKSTSVVEFWRRWHITLSDYLRDYLYISLGGNRHGTLRRHANLLLTMLLGGLWHGAGWTFILWGGLHGVFLVINHTWRSLPVVRSGRIGLSNEPARLLTFVAVVAAWVLFRAQDLHVASVILRGMAGLNGVSLPASMAPSLGGLSRFGVSFSGFLPGLDASGASGTVALALIALLGGIAFYAPSILELCAPYQPALGLDNVPQRKLPRMPLWRPNPLWAAATGIMAGIGVLGLAAASQFLYFQF